MHLFTKYPYNMLVVVWLTKWLCLINIPLYSWSQIYIFFITRSQMFVFHGIDVTYKMELWLEVSIKNIVSNIKSYSLCPVMRSVFWSEKSCTQFIWPLISLAICWHFLNNQYHFRGTLNANILMQVSCPKLVYNLTNWWLKFVKFHFSLYKIRLSFWDGVSIYYGSIFFFM